MKVGFVDDIEFHYAERSYSGGGEIKRGRRTESSGAHDEDLRGRERLLSSNSKFGKSQLPAVAPKLLRRKAVIQLAFLDDMIRYQR